MTLRKALGGKQELKHTLNAGRLVAQSG